MAFEVEAWWSANYNKYSIRDLQGLPIFHRFVQIHYPFERSDDNSHEKFYIVNGEVDVFEWTDKRSSRFELFQHDRKLDQYHYELRFRDADSPIVIRSWLQAELEWGDIVRDFGTFELHEGWRLEPPNRTYERFTIEQGIKKGFRAGIHPYKGDYERWVEDFWEFANEKLYKKQWYKEGESGGETTNNKADYTWGENWFSNSKRFEKKCWHKDGDHQWGHDLGKEPPRRWDHTWDFDPESRYEEKVTVVSGRDTGYRYWGNKDDWYKQEWEGLKMLEREDRCEEVVSSKIREKLDNLYTREYNSDMKQQQMLNMLALYQPAFQTRVKALEDRINEINLKDRPDVDALLDSIEALRTVGDDQEDLTFELFRGFRDDFDLLQTFNTFFIKSLDDSMQTLARIGKLVQDNGPYEDWVPKVQEFKEMPLGTITKGKRGMQLLGELEKTKYDELLRFKGGIPQEELERAMETLYQIMVKHDAVSDKIVELTRADDLKAKLDGMEDLFGEIHQNFLAEGDPNKLHEMLNLLLDYQPIHLHLMNRLRGYSREESNSEVGAINSAVEETKSAPSLKNTRAKVRSGRPTRETPFETMEKNLNRFAPALQRLLAAVDAPKSEIDKVEDMAGKATTKAEPVEVIMEKTRLLAEIAENAIPTVDTHETTVRDTDSTINDLFTSAMKFLEMLGDQDTVDKRKALMAQSGVLTYLPRLVLEKALSLKSTTRPIGEFVGSRLKMLSDLQEKVRVIDDELNRFMPEYDSAAKSVGASERKRLPVSSPPIADDPADAIVAKVKALNEVAEAARPDIASHDHTLKETDGVLNEVFDHGFKFLELVGEQELIDKRRALVQRSAELDYFPPLLLDKTKSLIEGAPSIAAFVGGKLKLLSELLQKVSAANDDLRRYLPKNDRALTSLGASEAARKPLADQIAALSSPDTAADELLAKVAALHAAADDSQASLEQHDANLATTDSNMNAVLESVAADVERLENGADLVAALRNLVAQSAGTQYFPPLVLTKSDYLAQNSPKTAALLRNFATAFPEMKAKLVEARDDLNKFIPLYVASLKSAGSDQSIIDSAESLVAAEDKPEADALLDQARGLRLTGTAEQPVVQAHDEDVKAADQLINQFFEATFPLFGNIENAEETIIQPRQELIARSEEPYLVPVVRAKAEHLAAHTNELEEWLVALEETQTSTTTQIEDLTSELANRSLIIEDLRKKIRELEKRIAILDEDLDNAKKYKPLYDEKCDEATASKIELDKLRLLYSDQTLMYEKAKREIEQIMPELTDLRDFKMRSLDLVNENERLKGIIKSFEDVLGDKKAQFEEVAGELQTQIGQRDAQIRDLNDELQKLRAQLAGLEKERRKQLMLRIISALSMTLKSEKTNTFLTWHFFANLPEELPPNTIMDETENPADFFDEELSEGVLARFKETEGPLVAERVSVLPANCILTKFWKVANGRFEKPSTPIECVPFWDDMLNKYYECIVEDFENKRRPLIFAEFTLESLFKALATRVSVSNRLGAHLPTIFRLYQAGHPYATVIARLLHLFSGNAAPLPGQVLVALNRLPFDQIAQEYEKERRGSNAIPASDLAISGGLAKIESVLERFESAFEDPRFLVEHWLRPLKPRVKLEDFVIAVLHKELRKNGVDPDAFWAEIDDGSANIDTDRFAQAAAAHVKFSQRLLREATQKKVSRDHFMELQSVDDDEFVVSKGGFLLGVLDAYLASVRRQTVELTDLFNGAGLAAANKDQFLGLAQQLDAAVDSGFVGKVFDEGLKISDNKDGLDLGAFVRVMIRYPLGRFAVPPRGVSELGRFSDVHVAEYDWLEGRKTTVTKTTKTVTTTKVRIAKKA